MLSPQEFFDLHGDPMVADLFADCDFVWDALPRLAAHVARLTGGKQTILGDVRPGAVIGDRPVYIAAGARIEPGAYVHGPAYIGAGAIVGHGAFVRNDVILLADSVLGHAGEAKNSLLLPGAHAAHFNYIGDSILGQRVNLGAGTKLSNLTVTSTKDAGGQRPTIVLTVAGQRYDTGLAKLGAILGDDAQTGCNSVLNPGTLVGPRTLIYANVSLPKGYYRPDQLIKLRQELVQAARV